MKRSRLAMAGTITAAVVLVLTSASAAAGAPSTSGHRDKADKDAFTFAVIGDIPYGDQQVADFPKAVAQINADSQIQLVDHLGDIKNGSTACSDDYFQLIKSDFDAFRDPLIYTIGDNEWTDCHRPNNGSYNPLERLAAVRTVFFSRPGYSLGQHSVRVASDARSGYPENVRYTRGNVSFGVPHIVGSNNSMAPWTGQTAATPEQTSEVLGRTASAVELIHDTFSSARADHNRAVVLMTQADMFDPTITNPSYADYYAFQPIVRAIAQESADFDGPVYLFNGDSHVYNSDKPLGSGSPWLALYGVSSPVNNLERITVDGSDNNNDFLKVTIQPKGKTVLSWTRVPYDF